MSKKLFTSFLFFHFLLFALAANSLAQQKKVDIVLGADEVGMNEMFTITLKVSEERLREYGDFPEIPGFAKRGTSSSSSTNIINGKISSSQSVTQNYMPQSDGNYTLPDFKISVNGQDYSTSGKSITVVPARQRQQQQTDPYGRDPFEDFFGRRQEPREQEFLEVDDDAFFALNTNKNEVFVGEDVTVTLAFYVADDNQAPLDFHNLGQQLSDILKKIRPEHAWEENFRIENIVPIQTTINNKPYKQYKIHQATLFPISDKPLAFPSVGLEMIKYKVAKNPSFFGPRREETFKTYYTSPKTVNVKPLPPHPMRDQIAVGRYSLSENLDKAALNTGESFNYKLKITGTGNITAIQSPRVRNTADFDIYDPGIQQDISRNNNLVSGNKTFSYLGIPKEPGTFEMRDYFNWVYFNLDKQNYDTLRPTTTLLVEGESQRNLNIQAYDLGSFYDVIASEPNSLRRYDGVDWAKIASNILLLSLLVVSAIVLFKRKS